MSNVEIPTRGLPVDVLRHADGGDYSLNGVSSKANGLTIVGILDCREQRSGVYVPLTGAQRGSGTVSDDAPAVLAVVRAPNAMGRQEVWHLAPADVLTRGVMRYMFGGNYAAGGSLLHMVGFYGAVAIHDRCETWQPRS